MRFRSSTVALFAFLAVAACSDGPATSPIRPFGDLRTISLEDYIQQQIDVLLPRGFETAVEARWSTIRTKKAAGDLVTARKQLNTLSDWIIKKQNDIIQPDNLSKAQAAAFLVSAMAQWVYTGNVAIYEVPSGDVAAAFVPAGQPLELSTEFDQAHVSLAAGSTSEDRLIVITEDVLEDAPVGLKSLGESADKYPGNCNGPLDTNRCQYPVFYKVESYPKTKLNIPGKIALCMMTGDRGPLSEGVHGRMQLAHQKPANTSDYTDGGIQENGPLGVGIEILPVSQTQNPDAVDCESDIALHSGMGPIQRALHAAMHLAAKVVTPKNAYAYDQGPEHDFSFFSNFNGVDPSAAPDLSVDNVSAPSSAAINSAVSVNYVIRNASPRIEGDATAAAVGTTARGYLSTDATLETATDIALGTASLGTIRPDGSQPVGHNFSLPATPGTYYVFLTVEQTGGLAEIDLDNNVAQATITVYDPIAFESGFEATDAAWTATGFWHASALGFPNTAYPSLVDLAPGDASGGALPGPIAGSFSMWYGQDATGHYGGNPLANENDGGTSTAANSGTISSPSFTVPTTLNAVTLSFQTWFEIESVDAHTYDSLNVVVEDLGDGGGSSTVLRLNPATDVNGTARTPFTSGGFNIAPAWVLRSVDLSAYRGKLIRLHFRFNTRDIQYNGFRGWIIDDVLVKVQTFAAPAFTVMGVKAKSVDAPAEPEAPRVWQP